MPPWEKYQQRGNGPWIKYKQQTGTDTSKEQKELIGSMGRAEKFLVGTGKGMIDVYTGIKQRGAEIGEKAGLVDKNTLENIKKDVKANREVFQPLADESTSANIGEFIGQAAPTLVVPGGVAGGFLKRAATSALSGGAVGAIQPTVEGESLAGNIAKGAGAGGLASGVISAGGKLVNTVAKKSNLSKVSEAAKKFGVRTTLGEDIGNPVVAKAETWLESIPIIGLKGFREKQQKEAAVAAKDFMAKYIFDPASPDAGSSNREYVNGLYEGFKGLVSTVKAPIEPTATKQTAKTLLARYPDIFKKFQDAKTEGLLADIVGGTKDIVKKSPVLDSKGRQIVTKTEKKLTFDELWTLRDGIGEMIGQARKKLGAGDVNKTQYGQMKQLFKSVSDDLDTWAEKAGRKDVTEAFKAANDSYKTYVVKYDVLRRAYDKATGEVGAGEMFSPKKFSTALKNIAYKDKELKKFSKEEIEEMTGLANVLQVVKRAGQYAENPPTGARWGLPTVGALAGIKAVPYVVVARFLSGTEAGKRLVMSSSKIEPKSPLMGRIVQEIYRQLPKGAAITATEE